MVISFSMKVRKGKINREKTQLEKVWEKSLLILLPLKVMFKSIEKADREVSKVWEFGNFGKTDFISEIANQSTYNQNKNRTRLETKTFQTTQAYYP